MAIPASITPVTVTGRYVKPDGSPAAGTVRFQLSAPASVPADKAMVPQTSGKATLDAAGAFSVTLAASDDPDWAVTGLTYQVTERITGAELRTYNVTIPADAPGGTVDLASLAPAVPGPPLVSYVLAATVGAVGGPAGPLDANGKIPASQVPASVFPVPVPTGVAATDTAAIQAAIDAASTAGGGIVALSNGTYLTTGLTMKTGVILQGSSSENVRLQLANGANTSVITSEGFAGLTGTQPADPTLTASGPFGWAIRGIEIVGNKANQTGTSWGIRVFGYGYVINDVRIRDCLSGGMYTEFAHSGPYSANASTGVEAEFTNLRIHHNGGVGWHMRGPNDSHAVGCMIWENTGFGFWAQTIPGGCSANGVNLFNVHAYGSGHTWGMVFDAQVMATGCQSEGASVGQVWMRYAECLWIGGAIYDIKAGGGSGLGLRLGDAATDTYAVRCYVATLITGWTGADAAHVAVDFARSSNCRVDGRVQLTTVAGVAIGGTPDASDVVALAVSGSGGMTTATALQRSVFKQRGVTTFDVGSASQGFRLANQNTDYFNLNTNATPVRFELPNGVQWRMYSGAYTNEKLRLDGAVGHIEAISTTVPGVAAAAGLGATPPAVAVDTNSNDMRGLVNFGTGTAPVVGAAVSVTFAQPFSRAPTVVLVARNGATAALQPYVGAISATGFNINLGVAPAASQVAGTYFVAYMVMG